MAEVRRGECFYGRRSGLSGAVTREVSFFSYSLLISPTKVVHDWPLIHLDDGFGGRWAVIQSTVWSFCVVVFPPFFDQDLCLAQAVEDFAVQELIPEPGIEAFAVSVFPR